MDAWVSASQHNGFDGIVGADVGFSEGIEHRDGTSRMRVVATQAGLTRLRQDGWQVDLNTFGTDARDGYRLTEEGFELMEELAASDNNAGLQQLSLIHI